MRIYRFDAETAKPILKYGSRESAFTSIAGEIPNAHIGVMHVAPGGLIGHHQAPSDQLFMVVTGAGWVSGEDRVRIEVSAGEAAFWKEGEWHESGSDGGMTALVIEAPRIEP